MKTWKTKSGYTITKVLAGRSNVFLVSNGNVNIMVDTGPARNRSRLQQNLRSLRIEKIDLLVLTHTHFDHAGNAGKIKEHFGAIIAVHTSETYYLKNGINMMPHGTLFFTKYLIRFLGNKLSGWCSFASCQPDIILDSAFHLNNFGFDAYILHTPGHSAGSVSLVVDNEIACVGDAMFGIFKNSILPPFADDPVKMVESWKKLLDTGCLLFLPAHGFENSRQKVERNYLKLV